METLAIVARRPPHGDVLKIPTPPLQRIAVALNFLFPAMALAIVVLRCYSKIRFRQFGIDDWLICFALLFALLMCPFFYMYIKLTYIGWRMEDVPADYNPSPGLWWFYIAQLFYNPVLALVKASVLFFLLRLGGHQRNLRWTIHAINIFNGLQAVAVFLVALLQCLPISANWDPAVKATARCVDVSFHVTISSLTILTDVAVIILPFWIFLGLKMPTPAKIAVIGVFLLGLVVLVTSVVRLIKLVQLFYAPQSISDPFHEIGAILNVIEINVAIVSASGPALRGLLRLWMPKWFGGSSRGKYGGASSSRSKQQYGPGSAYGRGTMRSGAPHEGSTASGLGRASRGGGGGGGIALKNMRPARGGHTEIRSISPSGSEEEIMTYNGIMRTTDVHVEYDHEVDANTTEGGSVSRASSDLKLEKEARQ